MDKKDLKFVFFGGEPLAIPALNELYKNGYIPEIIISNPDKPQGRKLEMTSPPTALWAKKHNVPLLQPEKLDQEIIQGNFDFFIVVSYGKIIPQEILDLPKLGTINIHPSLLPLYRGPSPIVSTILNGDKTTGVTIIKIDEKMDHGPILAQEKIDLSGNETIQDLENSLAELGSELLIKVIPDFVAEKIEEIQQNDAEATFCKKIKKEDGLITEEDLRESVLDQSKSVILYNKFRAYASWPRTFFFKDGKRIIITDAKLENGVFVIKKVIPEGGKETDYK